MLEELDYSYNKECSANNQYFRHPPYIIVVVFTCARAHQPSRKSCSMITSFKYPPSSILCKSSSFLDGAVAISFAYSKGCRMTYNRVYCTEQGCTSAYTAARARTAILANRFVAIQACQANVSAACAW
jgi:hypothetical protein